MKYMDGVPKLSQKWIEKHHCRESVLNRALFPRILRGTCYLPYVFHIRDLDGIACPPASLIPEIQSIPCGSKSSDSMSCSCESKNQSSNHSTTFQLNNNNDQNENHTNSMNYVDSMHNLKSLRSFTTDDIGISAISPRIAKETHYSNVSIWNDKRLEKAIDIEASVKNLRNPYDHDTFMACLKNEGPIDGMMWEYLQLGNICNSNEFQDADQKTTWSYPFERSKPKNLNVSYLEKIRSKSIEMLPRGSNKLIVDGKGDKIAQTCITDLQYNSSIHLMKLNKQCDNISEVGESGGAFRTVKKAKSENQLSDEGSVKRLLQIPAAITETAAESDAVTLNEKELPQTRALPQTKSDCCCIMKDEPPDVFHIQTEPITIPQHDNNRSISEDICSHETGVKIQIESLSQSKDTSPLLIGSAAKVEVSKEPKQTFQRKQRSMKEEFELRIIENNEHSGQNNFFSEFRSTMGHIAHKSHELKSSIQSQTMELGTSCKSDISFKRVMEAKDENLTSDLPSKRVNVGLFSTLSQVKKGSASNQINNNRNMVKSSHKSRLHEPSLRGLLFVKPHGSRASENLSTQASCKKMEHKLNNFDSYITTSKTSISRSTMHFSEKFPSSSPFDRFDIISSPSEELLLDDIEEFIDTRFNGKTNQTHDSSPPKTFEELFMSLQKDRKVSITEVQEDESLPSPPQELGSGMDSNLKVSKGLQSNRKGMFGNLIYSRQVDNMLKSAEFTKAFRAASKQRGGSGIMITRAMNAYWMKKAQLFQDTDLIDNCVWQSFTEMAGLRLMMNAHDYGLFLRKISRQNRMDAKEIIQKLISCMTTKQ